MDKILTVIEIDQPLPGEVADAITARMVRRRKAMHLTQEQLAARSGVSLGSLKRFERTSQISLRSLINLAFALRCEDDFGVLFAKPHYDSIDDAIALHTRQRNT